MADQLGIRRHSLARPPGCAPRGTRGPSRLAQFSYPLLQQMSYGKTAHFRDVECSDLSYSAGTEAIILRPYVGTLV